MNKSEFVSAIANANNVTQNDATQFVNSFIEIVGDTLSQGEDVALPGLAHFLRLSVQRVQAGTHKRVMLSRLLRLPCPSSRQAKD